MIDDHDFWPIASSLTTSHNGSMRENLKPTDLHQIAGLVTWLLVSGAVIYVIIQNPDYYGDVLLVAATLLLINLGGALLSGSPETANYSRWRLPGLWLQLGSVPVLAWFVPISFLPIFTIIWLAMAVHYFSVRTCLWFLVLLCIGWFLIGHFIWGIRDALLSTLLYSTFHLFALISANSTQVAEQATERAQGLNRELLATQHLLSEASRQSERTRIARDLHDLLGHHLTALTINLQIAGRLSDGDAKEKIERCHALTRLLLSDVREAVSTLREQAAVDFTETLRLIVGNIPRLKISLDCSKDLKIDDVEIAETLLKCVQESITNTLRHSGATELWIRVWREDGNVHLSVKDNGAVPVPIVPGNGLTGMRERLERVNGNLDVGFAESGVALSASIPLAD